MRNFAILAALSFLVAAGCNETTEGAEGNIAFTPDDCGGHTLGCAINDSIGEGGAINLNIRGIDGFGTAGVTLESVDTAILTVTAIGDVGGRPTWEVTAGSAGVGTIVALDADGVEVDSLQIGVQEITGLTLDNFLGNATGPTSDVTYDEAWQVNADEDTSFWVAPLIGDAVETMGRYTYAETQDMDPGDMLSTNDPLNGYIAFNAAAGTYEFEFTNDQTGDTLSVVIDVVGF